MYLAFFALGFVSFTDPDYWWHLRTGQYIVETRSIPTEDVFSYTATGKDWIAHEWLSEVLIYTGVANVGYAVTLGVVIAIILSAFGLMQRLLVRVSVPPIGAALVIVIGLMMSTTYWTVRPQVLSWALLALFISTLFQARRPVWWLIPVMALWANLHLGFLFGLAVIGLWYLSRLWELRSGEAFDWQRGALFAATCVLATLLNPRGPLLLTHAIPFAPIVGSAVDTEVITEWASPNFHEPAHAPLLVALLLLIAFGVTGRVRDTFAVLLAVSFAALALYSARYQPMFAVAFLPAAGLGTRDITLLTHPTAAPNRSTLNWVLVTVAAIAAVVVIPMLPQTQVDGEPRTNGSPYYPLSALEWVRQNQPSANVFASYEWGGYFANGLYPAGHVFVDGRADMYGTKVVQDYRSINAALNDWQKKLEDSGSTVVVVKPSSPLAGKLSYTAGWSTKLETPNEVVFVRNGS
jgi:hypothetical protein